MTFLQQPNRAPPRAWRDGKHAWVYTGVWARIYCSRVRIREGCCVCFLSNDDDDGAADFPRLALAGWLAGWLPAGQSLNQSVRSVE